jgi:hypothetical protein
MAPSYSYAEELLIVIGLKHFHKNDSQMLVAINNEIPLPIP